MRVDDSSLDFFNGENTGFMAILVDDEYRELHVWKVVAENEDRARAHFERRMNYEPLGYEIILIASDWVMSALADTLILEGERFVISDDVEYLGPTIADREAGWNEIDS